MREVTRENKVEEYVLEGGWQCYGE